MADEASGFDRDDEDRDPGRTDGADSVDDDAERAEPTTEWNPSSRPLSSERDVDGDHRRDGSDGGPGDPDAHRTPDERTRVDDDANRIRLDLSGDDSGSGTDSQVDSDPRAPEPSSTPIEAGDPALENVLFVVLGAVAAILVIVRFVSVPL